MFIYEGFVVFWDDTGTSSILCEDHYNNEKAFSVHLTDNSEVDSPMHCQECHKPLKCTLTDDGIKYVFDAIKRSIHDDCWDKLPPAMGYYSASPNTEIVADWARQLGRYGLDKWQAFIREAYLEWVPPTNWHQQQEKNS